MTYFLFIGCNIVYKDDFDKDGRLRPMEFSSMEEIEEYIADHDCELEGKPSVKAVKNPKAFREIFAL